MNDFDKGFMMGMAMGDDDDDTSQNEGCEGCFKTLVSGILIYIGAMVAAFIIVLLIIWLIGSR